MTIIIQNRKENGNLLWQSSCVLFEVIDLKTDCDKLKSHNVSPRETTKSKPNGLDYKPVAEIKWNAKINK